MASIKKIPQRFCVGCQEVHPKKELVRIVRSPEGEFSVDFTGKKAGRGTYICAKIECFEAAQKAHRFSKSFKENISEETIEMLKEQFWQARRARND